MTANYYVLIYSPGADGCPHYLSGDYSPETWEFDTEEPAPQELSISKEYSLRITDPETTTLSFDFYEPAPAIVSSEFMQVCDVLKIKYRATPLKISLSKNRPLEKKYAFFLPVDHAAPLDVGSSIAEPEIDVDTGSPLINKAFPPTPIYAKIDHFVPKRVKTPLLFHCVEIHKIVCTEEFRANAFTAELRGIDFVPLDTYKHDPWA